ncbi:MAG TPA: sugar O-acetyltransferase [Erysipelothrix sp.]|nr:sugar O-acetyltransferase [Erysipelothrix sp.]
MNNIEKRDKGLGYIVDDEILEQLAQARSLTQKLNALDRANFRGIEEIITQLFGSSNKPFVNPPFYCDYGFNIHVGKNFYCNFNCTFLDVAPITIGDNVWIGSNVSLYTAGHPIHPETRNTQIEYGRPITIGDNVWIGGNVVINPGVSIESNTVIGSGSVVTKDIPDWVVAAGNPCRVIRKITEDDRDILYKNESVKV